MQKVLKDAKTASCIGFEAFYLHGMASWHIFGVLRCSCETRDNCWLFDTRPRFTHMNTFWPHLISDNFAL